MALRVWLPLNGNLNNQGLSNLVFNSSGSPVIQAGKIGNNYYLDGSSYFSTNETDIGDFPGSFTMCIWFKSEAVSAWTRLCGRSAHKQYQFDINSAGKLRFWTSTDGTDADGHRTVLNSTNSIADNVWHHACGVCDGTKLYLYIDGILNESKDYLGGYSLPNAKIFVGMIDTAAKFKGMVADFRLYDEALSLKQIKEISKGLVAHYKLTGVGANKNYIKNSDWSNKTNGGIYTFNGNEVTFHSDVFEVSGHSFAQTMDSAGITDFRNKVLTFSMEYQITEPLVFGTKNPWVGFELNISRNTTTGGSNQWLDWYGGKSIPTAVTDGWVYYKCSVTVTDYDIASIGINFYMRDTTGTIKYRHPKVEVGNVATPWIPNEADALYSSLGYENDICTDVSGYKYDAIKNGTFIFDTDSPRYNGCNNFSIASTYLKLPILNTAGFANSFTIIYWAKIADMTNKMAWGFEDGNRLNIYPTNSVICCNTGDSANNPYQKDGTSIGFSKWNNEWHQFAMTADGTSNKLYVDGVLQGIAKTYKGITGTQIYLSGWASSNSYRWTDGSISDFRIYATPLSADEILTMYKNSGIIDNKGNVYAYEFKEE